MDFFGIEDFQSEIIRPHARLLRSKRSHIDGETVLHMISLGMERWGTAAVAVHHALENGSVQALLLKKLVHQVCDFKIVQIREWKVCVATNAYFGQMYDRDMTTSAVHSIPP